MQHRLVRIDCSEITDLHGLFAETFGFPDFYGHNWDAWIDCMSHLDEPDAGLSTIHVEKGGIVVIQLEQAEALKRNQPDLLVALCESAAFVNWRRIEAGGDPILCLSFAS
ncbi:barstar family protein [Mesorhizobium sp. NPDC059054]|uniref:barstar family protein n=1 Tax=Mesorhizobium sp. NPDC059054 TaxID=3346711 RepID=UPI0036B53630